MADHVLDDTLAGAPPSAASRRVTREDAAAAPELAPGTRIGGRYEVLRRLGAGGMGVVYEAEHLALRRRVAVKVLHGEAGLEPSVVERFLREARAVSAVRHRNVVEVTDFGADDGHPWLVMELLDGESLAARIARAPRCDVADALRILDPILRALHHAHVCGFVHRDVKPDNVFLAREPGVGDDVPKLLDFGIAKNVESGEKFTATGAMIGTPAYMAPEQITHAFPVTPATDQFAVGVMLYEMLSASLPHVSDSLHAMLFARAQVAAPPLSQLRPDLPTALVDAVMRALATNPSDRFPDLEAMRRALLAAAPAASLAGDADAVVEPAARPSETAVAPSRRPSWRWLAVAAAVVLTLAALSAVRVRGHRREAAAIAPTPVAAPFVAPPAVATVAVEAPPSSPAPTPVVAAPVALAPAIVGERAASERPRRTRAASPSSHGRLRIDARNPLAP